MKNAFVIACALAVVSTGAMAQKKDKAPAAPKKAPCVVMEGHDVDVKEAVGKKNFVDYKGKRYVFCCAGCKPTFEKEPEKFAKKGGIPIPAKK